MILYIVRHGLAGEPGDPRFPDDSLRPLTKEGRKRFNGVAKKLAKRGVAPTLIASSPLVRCRQTADILSRYAPADHRLIEVDALKPGASLSELIAWTRRYDATEVAWVGHAPDVANLLSGLVGAAGLRMKFSKGAVAAIEFAAPIAPGGGELRWLATAKLLGE